jgi:mannosyltransferase
LRLFRLGHQSLWVDEILTWNTVTTTEPMTLARLLENVHGPVYSLLLHGWCRIAGESEWALRLPSAVFGILLIPAIAWLASRWLGRGAAVTAAWLAAGSPFLVWYAQEARNYSMLMLCVAVAGALLLGMTRRISGLPLIGYLLVSATGLLSNFSYAFVGPVHLVWWLGPPGGRGRRLALALGAAALLALVVLPWSAHIRGNWDWRRLTPQRATESGETALRGETTFHPAAIPFAFHSFAVGYTLGPSLRELRSGARLTAVRRHLPEVAATTIVFGALSLLGLVGLRRRGRLGEALLWAIPGLLFVSYSAIQNFKTFHPRYLAVLMPMLIATWAVAIVDLPRHGRRVAVTLVALLCVVSLAHHYFDDAYAKEDVRGAVRVVQEHGVPGERVIAVNTVGLLGYYYRGPLPVEHYWLGFARDSLVMQDRFRSMKGGGPAWVLLARPEDLDPEGRFARWMDGRYPDAGRWDFAGVRLWRVPADTVAAGAS